MALPGNGVFVVQGEMSTLVTAMRRGARWSSHSHQDEDHDMLLKGFHDLKTLLNRVENLKLIDPNIFLDPFLDVIKSEETTGPVTSLALSSIHKFLSYGLIDADCKGSATAVENIAGAITRARFVGTDANADALVLLRILHSLRALILSPPSTKLSDNAICDVALSCFRICFEFRLNEILRRTAEQVLRDIVQFLFLRLPEFTDDAKNTQKIKMLTGSMEQTRNKRKNKSLRNKSKNISNNINQKDELPSVNTTTTDEGFSSPPENKHLQTRQINHLSTTPITPVEKIVDMQGLISQCTPVSITSEQNSVETSQTLTENIENDDVKNNIEINVQSPASTVESQESLPDTASNVTENKPEENSLDNITTENQNINSNETSETSEHCLSRINSADSNFIEDNGNQNQEYVNPRGVRFMVPSQEQTSPYGIVCIRELFRFLISLCNPLDKQNNELMIHLGLTLLTVAFEVGADNIGKYNSFLALCKDELSRNLFSLLSTERISIFAADLQVCFLLFESLRTHLKFQLEFYLTKLIEIIISDSVKVTYEHKEIALDNIVQMWRIPGLVTELYLNYDCDIYCTNLFEDLTKLLAKNAFPVTAGLYHTHLLSLDALLTIIESIKNNCSSKDEKDTKTDDIEDESIQTNFNKVSLQSRQKISDCIPTHEELMVIKTKKRWLPQGTEYFNTKPKKGIQFLQEHGILKGELNCLEVTHFLRENPGLDKKMIGEYISSRSNLQVLEVFVKSFDFTDLRIDEALRLYLETFRLPGEAPLISLLLEHFAEHWHKCNGEPFENADAAFTLAYAVIMLNVDQHNHNVKRQNTPMTADEFKRNLKKVNGGKDFDQDMLDEIYSSIKNEEIVMPAEQTGIVRENYLWKVLLRRGVSKDGTYIHVANGYFDRDLFNLIWGPIVAALSFVFDKSEDVLIYERAMRGFQKCAYISAQFNMSNNLDMLVVTLCKFSMLNNQQKTGYSGTLQFGTNEKAQLAFKTVLGMIRQHGDILREGWKNMLELFSTLYSYQLLPKYFTEAEDFVESTGHITLVRETVQSQKTETGLFSSLYSYMLSSDIVASKIPSVEEQETIEFTKRFIAECNLEHLVTESKFLQIESLKELIKALLEFTKWPDGHKSLGTGYDENMTVFFLELLLKIVIQNRDRVMLIWQQIQDHVYGLIMSSATYDYPFLLERSIISLLYLAVHLMRNEEMSPVVLQSLQMLLLLKPVTLYKISKQIAFGLFELLKTSAQNIHSDTDWKIVFTLLECVGAGSQPPKTASSDGKTNVEQGTKSDGEAQDGNEEELVVTDRGYTSDSELTRNTVKARSPLESPVVAQHPGGWILVGKEGEVPQSKTLSVNQFTITLERRLGPHNPAALLKCCESLAFLVRDVAHITPYNFEDCVHCIRIFVEASLNGKKHSTNRDRRKQSQRRRNARGRTSPADSVDDESDLESDECGDEAIPAGYHQVSIQLLDLTHTLHTRTAQIFRWWAEEHGDDIAIGSLWPRGWCPLLQGIARLCCDKRKQVRMAAITYLQRALLMPDLQALSGPEWEACFHRVLFPLLVQLLEPTSQGKAPMEGVEESRMKAATVLSKVFLHHLTPLLTLSTFTALWLTILEFMDKYMHAGNSDLLYEAIPESLKNMLLVMDSAKVFHSGESYSQLWDITWDRISIFLPNLKDELFKTESKTAAAQNTAIPEPPEVTMNQHDVVNATRNSIILQPPTVDNVASPLFAHLGQMVSTPIGMPSNNQQYTSPTLNQQHTVSVQSNVQTQNYPLFYNVTSTSQPESTMSTQHYNSQPQAIPLYTDYINNPYNMADPSQYHFQPPNYGIDIPMYQSDTNQNLSGTYPIFTNNSAIETTAEYPPVDTQAVYNPPQDSQHVPNISQQNLFQGSNYFYPDKGTEILYENEQARSSHTSNVLFFNPASLPGANIPLVPPDIK